MKKKLTTKQQIHRLEQSIKKFGDPHKTKVAALKELKKQTIDIPNTL